MALHFTTEEFSERQHRTIEQLKNRQLDGLLMFRQESMYYLSGYDSFGYVFFQCLYLDIDGNLMLLTRTPDLLQARHTSVIEDIRIWQDNSEADPAVQLKQILDEFSCRGRGRTKGTFWRPCKGSFFPVTATTRATNLSSAQDRMRFYAVTNPGVASSTPGIN
jgi:Xaa-Pro dipeptidase